MTDPIIVHLPPGTFTIVDHWPDSLHLLHLIKTVRSVDGWLGFHVPHGAAIKGAGPADTVLADTGLEEES